MWEDKMLAKERLPLAVLLLKFHFIATSRAIIGADINVCKNVEDHIFLQDIEDCSKYIVCINGQDKSQQCQSGLYFDVRQQACTASKLNCLKCPTDRIINVPLHKTCDKYISCYYGQSLLKKCATNQQFNVRTGKCDLTRNVDCVENRCSIYATDKEEQIFVPSAANCSNYYVCQAGQAKIQTCAEGFYFSKECNCCDKSENVACLIDELKTPANSSNQNKLNIDVSKLKHKSTLVGKTNKVKCPPIGHFLYQYIEDAAYFFTCVEGKASLYACPSDFLFDDKVKRCKSKEKEPVNTNLLKDHNHDNELQNKQINYEMDINSSNISNKYQLSSLLTGNSTSLICPNLGTFISPHVQKNRYYVCIDGNAIGFACDQGHVFDAITNTCKHEDNLTDSDDNQIPKVLDETVDILCPPVGAMKFAHKQKQKFYLCVNGMGSILACAEGSFFESQSGICRRTFDLMIAVNTTIDETSTENVPIDKSSPLQCPVSGTFIYAHAEENLYSVCLDGKPLVLTCPEGLIFDDRTKKCSSIAIHTEYIFNQTSKSENEEENIDSVKNTADVVTIDEQTPNSGN